MLFKLFHWIVYLFCELLNRRIHLISECISTVLPHFCPFLLKLNNSLNYILYSFFTFVCKGSLQRFANRKKHFPDVEVNNNYTPKLNNLKVSPRFGYSRVSPISFYWKWTKQETGVSNMVSNVDSSWTTKIAFWSQRNCSSI